MGCTSSTELVVPVPFPQDAVSMSFFGEENIAKCIEYLHSIVTTSPERIEALQNVKTYILEAGNNEDVSTITVEDPVKEIVAVHEAMQHRLREQHSQSFDTSLLNQQLPTPLPRRVVNKMVKLFERVNVDRSGAISLRQFHTWAKQVAMSGRDAEETEARADIPFSVFVPLLMLLNFTAVPFQLNALEFVVMLHDLLCLPDRAIIDMLFDCFRRAALHFHPDTRPRRSSRHSNATRKSRRSQVLPDASGVEESKGAPPLTINPSEPLTVEDMCDTPHPSKEVDIPRDEQGGHVYISDSAPPTGVTNHGHMGKSGRKMLVMHSKMLGASAGASVAQRRRRLRAFDEGGPSTNDDAEHKAGNVILGATAMSTIHEVFAQVGALEVGELEVASKRLERASSGKKTVHFVPHYVGCASTSAFLACFEAAHDVPEGSATLVDRLRQLQQPPNASRRFLFHEPEVEHAGLSRGHWTAVNEWHTQLLAPVFEFRTLLWRYIMGSKFWLGRQEHVKEMARQQRELEEAGQGGMYHLTEVGMTAEHKEYLQGKQREGARNRFNLVEQDVVNAMGTTVDAQVQPPPGEIESTQRGAGVVEGHVEAGGAEGCNEAAAAVETVADVDSEVVPGTPVHAG